MLTARWHSFWFLSGLISATICGSPSLVAAEGGKKPPKSAFSVFDIFDKTPRSNSLFDVKLTRLPSNRPKAKDQVLPKKAPAEQERSGEPVFVGDHYSKHQPGPDGDYPVRLNEEAPAPFIKMVKADREKKYAEAEAHADQFVRYLANTMFEVRKYTKYIGRALIRNGFIKEDDWDGVEQLIDWHFAKAREENYAAIRATHDQAMKNVTPDPNNQAEIYYFFTLNSQWSRRMAPDVERMWQVAKRDPRISMVALTLGPQPKDWIESYRHYTGLTVPIKEGQEVAKAFDVAFAPAVVVVAPGRKQAYLKTGQQSFTRLYEFVRTVQGLPVELTPFVEQLINTPIAEFERQTAGGKTHRVRVQRNFTAPITIENARF